MRAALALALVLGTTATAAADGIYFTESFGASNVKNELGNEMEDAFRLRLSVGYRLTTSWAVEAWFAGDMGTGDYHASHGDTAARCIECTDDGPRPSNDYHHGTTAMASVGVDVKYLRPLSEHLEVYLRGSLGKAWLDRDSYAGRGLGIGTGIQLKGKVPAVGFLFWPLFFTNWGPKVTAAVFVDAGTDFYRLHKNGELDNPDAIDASLSRLTIGWAVGADF